MSAVALVKCAVKPLKIACNCSLDVYTARLETFGVTMAIEAIPGGKFNVTIKAAITREAAAKTLERLFMGCKTASSQVVARSANFKAKPKRRGGRIWTKYPNKLHLDLAKGVTATIKATPQHARDLNSVAEYVDVKTA